MIVYYLYILKSNKSHKYYIGCTDNPNRRITEHNSGLSKYTKVGIPWILVYTECYNTLSEARIREIQVKNWKKRKSIERLIDYNKEKRSHRLAA